MIDERFKLIEIMGFIFKEKERDFFQNESEWFFQSFNFQNQVVHETR